MLTLRPWDYGHGLDDAAAGYGFATPDGRIWAAHHCLWSTWDQLGVLVINVVGETYHLDDRADPGFEPGARYGSYPRTGQPARPKAIAIRNWTARQDGRLREEGQHEQTTQPSTR